MESIRKYNFEEMKNKFCIDIDVFLNSDTNSMAHKLITELLATMDEHSSIKNFTIKSNDLIPNWANEK